MKKKDSTQSNQAATKRDVENIVEKAVEKMALMVKHGFDRTATKEDLQELRKEMNERFATNGFP